MSASPPPPPPYSSAPVAPPTSAWDRHTIREQRRVAQMQFRQQRALQRAQLRAARRTSVLGPVLLLTLGVAFLLVEVGSVHLQVATFWLSRWWPLVLVAAGFVLLAEWAMDSWISTQRGTPPPRRRVGAGTGLLLVLVIVAGVAVMAAQNRSTWIARGWNPEFVESLGLDQFFAPHSDIQTNLSAPLASKGLITIQNFHGTVTVNGDSPDGEVHVSAHQHLVAWQGRELRAKQQRDRPLLQAEGDGLLLRVSGEGRDQTDLTVEVPHESSVTIAPEKGDINVNELRGPLIISDHSGNITLTALTGSIHVTVRDDNATISGHSLSGDLTVDGRSGDLALSDVTGPVNLHGDFFGTTHLERIKGPVHFQSSFTDFASNVIPGELNIEGRSELQATGLDGPVVLKTSDRNLTLSGVRHGATLENRNGSVALSLADPLGPVKVSTTDGPVDLRIPERAGFVLSADTSGGQLTNDLGLNPQHEGDRLTLTGKLHAGGPAISLHTTEGDIRIHKGTDNTQTAEEPRNPEDTHSSTDDD